MATVETSPTPMTTGPADLTPATRRLFSLDEFHWLAEKGFFQPDERVELLQGEIYRMTPPLGPHASCVYRLTELFILALHQRAIVSVQSPLRLPPHSQPEPDLMLMRPRVDYYRSGLPGPGDAFLVVEVMASSADMDRKVKLGLYARAGVAEVWLVDLNVERVEVYRRPADGQYHDVQVASRGQTVSPEAFADVVLGVDAILG